jgi:hypothetical protein
MSQQDAHFSSNGLRQRRHRTECHVLVSRLDLREILLRQAGSCGEFSLREPDYQPGRPQVLAKGLGASSVLAASVSVRDAGLLSALRGRLFTAGVASG